MQRISLDRCMAHMINSWSRIISEVKPRVKLNLMPTVRPFQIEPYVTEATILQVHALIDKGRTCITAYRDTKRE